MRIRKLNQKGFSILQAMIAGTVMVSISYAAYNLITQSLQNQRQVMLRDQRQKLMSYYTGVLSNPNAFQNTVKAVANVKLKDHIEATLSPALTPTDWSGTIEVLDLYSVNDSLLVPSTGLYLMANGSKCPGHGNPADSCNEDKASWIVRPQWIPLAKNDYETRIIVQQHNKKDQDILLKTSLTDINTSNSALSGKWDSDPVNADNIQYTKGSVGIGTKEPQQMLELSGPMRISSDTFSKSSYYLDIIPTHRLNDDMYIDFVMKDEGGLDNGNVLTIRGQDGKIGIGTINPTGDIHVSNGNVNTAILLTNTTSSKTLEIKVDNAGDMFVQDSSTTANALVIKSNGNVGIGETNPSNKLHVDGDVTANAFLATSDARLKRKIKSLGSSLAKLLKLKPVSYELKTEQKENEQIGFLAHELEKEFPEVVHTGSNGYKAVDYSRLVAPLINAIREQQNTIQKQSKAIEELRKEMRQIKHNSQK